MNSTDIESDAITNFRTYLKGCPNISAHISENDRGISWDGFLDMFSDGVKDKNHYVDHIYIQIKGRIVDKLKDECKYPIDKSDLELYRTEPVIYVVCQMESRVSEYNLFYRSLLPETIKNLLKGKDKQKTVSVAMKKIPENARDFEDIVSVFISDKERQMHFVNRRSISLEEAEQRGIKSFQFCTPARRMTQLERFCYLSKTPSFMYAIVNEEYNFSVPIDGGPMSVKFEKSNLEDIYIGDKIYKKLITTIIEHGQIVMTIGGVLHLKFSGRQHDKIQCHAQLNAEFLNERIEEAEFILSIAKAKKLVLKDYTLQQENMSNLENLEHMYEYMLRVKSVMDCLHICKPLNMIKMTQPTFHTLEILYDTLILGKHINASKDSEGARILTFEDINILLWIQRQKDGAYSIEDFLGGNLPIVSPIEKKQIQISPYCYLTNQNKWANVDNIDYDQILPWAQRMVKEDQKTIPWINNDALAMIAAADELELKDKIKYNLLLDTALSLIDWLLSIHKKEYQTYKINQIQIYKRRGGISKDQEAQLQEIVRDEKASASVVTAAYLLLEDREMFIKSYNNLSKTEQRQFKKYPIWKFAGAI